MPTDEINQIAPKANWNLLSGESLQKILDQIKAQGLIAGEHITLDYLEDGTVINYDGGDDIVPGSVCVTMRCKQALVTRLRHGWFVANPDPGYGNPAKYFMSASVSIVNNYNNPEFPFDYFENSAAWEAHYTIPDCSGAGVGPQDDSPIRMGCTDPDYTGYIYVENVSGHYLDHYPGRPPDPSCGLQQVDYGSPPSGSTPGPRRIQCLEPYSTSGVFEITNCCCNDFSWDKQYWRDIWGTCGFPNTVSSNRRDDSIDIVCDSTAGYHFSYHLLLQDEDTYEAMVGRAEACLAAAEYPDDWSGSSCAAQRDSGNPEMTAVTMGKFQYQFVLPEPLSRDIKVCWNLQLYEPFPLDEGPPINIKTPMFTFIFAGQTESAIFEQQPPGEFPTNGGRSYSVADVRCTGVRDECPPVV